MFRESDHDPETGFTKFYEAKHNSGSEYATPAYAIHSAIRQIIDDQEIQDYILCRRNLKVKALGKDVTTAPVADQPYKEAKELKGIE